MSYKDKRKRFVLTFFFTPTWQKLIFLVEWIFFILITIFQGKLTNLQMVLLAGYPLLFFYLIACTFAALKRKLQMSTPLWKLLTIAMCLLVIDQGIKALVEVLVPYQSSLPIFTDWFHLAHERNVQGAWIISLFTTLRIPIMSVLVKLLMVAFVLLAIPSYQYYTATYRRSLWADIAFVGVVTGLASWISDMSFRGYIVDYIQLPRLVTADLKDIYALIGVAAFLVEAMENHVISLRWDRWHKEKNRLLKLGKGLIYYSLQDLRRIWTVIIKTGRGER